MLATHSICRILSTCHHLYNIEIRIIFSSFRMLENTGIHTCKNVVIIKCRFSFKWIYSPLLRPWQVWSNTWACVTTTCCSTWYYAKLWPVFNRISTPKSPVEILFWILLVMGILKWTLRILFHDPLWHSPGSPDKDMYPSVVLIILLRSITDTFLPTSKHL